VEIILSKHAKLKTTEREIEFLSLKKIFKHPDYVYFDLLSKTFVAVGKITISGIETNLIVPFVKEGKKIKIVTVYPCKYLRKELKSKEGKRWVRIK
jgi:hypothetical protein